MIKVCALTGKKLGRKAVNGIFKYDRNVCGQISLIYRHPIDPKDFEKGFKKGVTFVHIPVSKDAIKTGLSLEHLKKIEKYCMEDDSINDAFEFLYNEYPDAVLFDWVEDKLPF